MKLQTIIYTPEMDRAVEWYSQVLNTEAVYRSDVWSSFTVGDAKLAIHRSDNQPNDSRAQLSLVATETLEDISDRLTSSQIAIHRGIQEETFGRSLLLKDPDGFAVQVNEHEVR